MNRIKTGVLCGFGGGMVAIGGVTLAGAIHPNEATQRAGIEACAASLSPEATQNTEVPEPCEYFRFVESETTQKIIVNGIMRKTVVVEFDLPSSDDFSAYANEEVTTDVQQNAMDKDVTIMTTAIWALMGLALPFSNTQAGNKLITAEE